MLEAIVGALIAGFILWMLKLYYIKFRGKTLFRLCFVDHPPPHEQQIDRWGPHIIPPRDSEHYLRITCKEALKVSRCNVRFIDLEELTKSPGEPLIDIRHIVRLKELSVSARITTRGVTITSAPDDKGGMHVVFSPPMELVARESFVMKLFVQAQGQAWDGKISFRGLGVDTMVRCFVASSERNPSLIRHPAHYFIHRVSQTWRHC